MRNSGYVEPECWFWNGGYVCAATGKLGRVIRIMIILKVRRMMAKNRQDTIVETQQINVTMGLVSGNGKERPGFGATKEK